MVESRIHSGISGPVESYRGKDSIMDILTKVNEGVRNGVKVSLWILHGHSDKKVIKFTHHCQADLFLLAKISCFPESLPIILCIPVFQYLYQYNEG